MNDHLVLHPGQTVSLNGLSPSALAAALRTHLPAFWESTDAFLIVENGQEQFVQLLAHGPDAYTVEYGDHGTPFEYPGDDRTLDETVAIFERFAGGVWPPFEDGMPLLTGGSNATPSFGAPTSFDVGFKTAIILLSLGMIVYVLFFL